MIAPEDIQKAVLEKLSDAEVFAKDLTGGQDHYELFVVSDDFIGKNIVQCHQMVMEALKEPLKGPLHAISLKTFTKKAWQELG